MSGAELRRSELAPNLLMGVGVTLGEGVELGANVVIHAGVDVADGCRIEDGAVVGKPPQLRAGSRSPRTPCPRTRLGDGVTVSVGAVVLAGASLGARAVVAIHGFIRERAVLGEDCQVGNGAVVGRDVRAGDRVRIQANAILVSGSVAEDDVFVGPTVSSMNDASAGRARGELRGVVLRRGCRIGGSAALLPGVEIGENALVGAGAVVTSDVPANAVALGVPARVVGEVPAAERLR